jgi:hypothetical protein
MDESGESDKKTENDYLELGDCFKDIVAVKDKKFRELKEEHIKVFKLLMMSYSVIRITDTILSGIGNIDEMPPFSLIKQNIELLRTAISEYIDELHEVDSDYEDDE